MTATHSASTAHRENVLEEHMVEQLVKRQGYEERSPTDFDRDLGFDRELVLSFIKDTQDEQWAKL